MTDQEKLAEFTRRAQEKANQEAADLEKKVSEKRSQIEKLLHQREEVKNFPMTPQETLAIAKRALAEGRKSIFMEDLLIPHLKDVQNRHSDFLPPASLRVHFVDERRLAQWVFSNWITEADLIQAAAALPADIGITEVERKKREAAIDEKIKKLEGEIEKLLA